jgi:hypothetical protein
VDDVDPGRTRGRGDGFAPVAGQELYGETPRLESGDGCSGVGAQRIDERKPLRRLARWARRHRTVAQMGVASLALLLLAAAGAREHRRRRRGCRAVGASHPRSGASILALVCGCVAVRRARRRTR